MARGIGGWMHVYSLLARILLFWNRFLSTEITVLFIHLENFHCIKVNANGHYEHHCSIAFFTPGSYKLDVVCKLLPARKPSVTTNTSHATCSRPHVWKLIPPVEVTVLELWITTSPAVGLDERKPISRAKFLRNTPWTSHEIPTLCIVMYINMK